AAGSLADTAARRVGPIDAGKPSDVLAPGASGLRWAGVVRGTDPVTSVSGSLGFTTVVGSKNEDDVRPICWVVPGSASCGAGSGPSGVGIGRLGVLGALGALGTVRGGVRLGSLSVGAAGAGGADGSPGSSSSIAVCTAPTTMITTLAAISTVIRCW